MPRHEVQSISQMAMSIGVDCGKQVSGPLPAQNQHVAMLIRIGSHTNLQRCPGLPTGLLSGLVTAFKRIPEQHLIVEPDGFKGDEVPAVLFRIKAVAGTVK